jgi:8-oxo-dGTP diphosphatase
MTKNDVVRVGVSAIIRRGPAVLMGKRKGSHGQGGWAFPGGHLEMGESVIACAARESLEEVGLLIPPGQFRKMLVFTNDIFKAENKHYITLYTEVVLAPDDKREPRLMEPDKCEGWAWWESPPEPLFLPVQNLIVELGQEVVWQRWRRSAPTSD